MTVEVIIFLNFALIQLIKSEKFHVYVLLLRLSLKGGRISLYVTALSKITVPDNRTVEPHLDCPLPQLMLVSGV